MHRRGGKRIRMDDPPPEYDNPLTPSTPASAPAPEFTPTYNATHDSSGEYGSGSVAGEETPAPAEPDEDEAPPPTPPPTKRVTRSKGKVVGRLAESPPPPMPKRGRGRGRGRGARHHAPSPPPVSYSPPPFPAPGDDDTSLYSVLRYNKTTINNVVDLWIEQYKTNKEHALVQLMQFFINSSGCKGKISPDMASMEHHLIIRKMTQEFDEESGEYPLIMTGTPWKKFKANFCEFIQTLVKMCQYSIIYDQYLMDNIISLLTGLSDSQVRAFRHTATLAVMKLMTALVDVALLTSVNCDNCQRQYEAERLKARDKRATDRLELLVTKRQELEENMEEIKNMLSYMFKSVFVHRYRDTLPEIRAIAMSEIGIWMEKFPAHFLDDLYLKYIGWTLHDKVGEVRLKCLQALQPLYQTDDLKGKLELFTSKFKDRIVGMSLDKEYEVAVQAVRLVIFILKMHPDVLTDKDCENVYELVYSSHRHVAQAAGEFLNVRLFRLEEDAPQLRSRRGKKRLPNTPLIRDLVQFFIESELHEHGAYLVDSLIESNPMMKDWECMTDLLLEEAGPGEEALDNRQESSLIELMVCCVRQASTGEPPVGRGTQRKHHHTLSKEQNKVVSDDRQKLTVHFIPTLPQLLQKFGADPEKLTNLVSIPQYFDLEVYTTHRQEQNLTELLNKLRDIVTVQTEPEVLEMCGRTLEFLCSDTAAIYTRCNVARSTITDLCVNRYKEAADEYRNLIAGGEEPDPDEIFSVTNWTRKVSIMYMCHNLNNTNIWDSLFEDLPKCTKETEMPAEALVYALRSCYYSLLWSLHELEERLSAGADVSAPAATLRERLHSYVAQCRLTIADGATPQLKEEAYTSICDLLIYFSEHLSSVHHRNSPAVAELVYEPDNDLCDLLNSFIQQFVFIQQNYDGQDERRIEELHKRRNFLAAYCKLIVYNVTPIRRAADVFKYYIKCYNDYGDIIKATVSKAREMNKLNCALTMELAMQANFTDIVNQHATIPRNLQEFVDLKELAKRFSVMFGLDAVKNREAVTALHRAGIAFAVLDAGSTPGLPPRNIQFLEILSEMTNKLIKQDRRVVLKYLDARVASGVAWGDEWQPLLSYRNSLVQAEGAEERAPATRRAYTRRRQQEDDEAGDDNAESEGEANGRHLRRSKRAKFPRLPVCVTPARMPTLRRRSSPSASDPHISPPSLRLQSLLTLIEQDDGNSPPAAARSRPNFIRERWEDSVEDVSMESLSPLQSLIVDNTSMERPVVDNLLMEPTVVDNLPMERPVVDNLPIERPVVDNLPMERPVVDNLPMERPVVDNLPMERPVVDNLPMEPPVIDNVSMESSLSSQSTVQLAQQISVQAQVHCEPQRSNTTCIQRESINSVAHQDTTREDLHRWSDITRFSSSSPVNVRCPRRVATAVSSATLADTANNASSSSSPGNVRCSRRVATAVASATLADTANNASSSSSPGNVRCSRRVATAVTSATLADTANNVSSSSSPGNVRCSRRVATAVASATLADTANNASSSSSPGNVRCSRRVATAVASATLADTANNVSSSSSPGNVRCSRRVATAVASATLADTANNASSSSSPGNVRCSRRVATAVASATLADTANNVSSSSSPGNVRCSRRVATAVASATLADTANNVSSSSSPGNVRCSRRVATAVASATLADTANNASSSSSPGNVRCSRRVATAVASATLADTANNASSSSSPGNVRCSRRVATAVASATLADTANNVSSSSSPGNVRCSRRVATAVASATLADTANNASSSSSPGNVRCSRRVATAVASATLADTANNASSSSSPGNVRCSRRVATAVASATLADTANNASSSSSPGNVRCSRRVATAVASATLADTANNASGIEADESSVSPSALSD